MIATGKPMTTTAPDFTLPADDGTKVTLSALRPAPVVLFFYPKDDTPGCTTEARDFSNAAKDFAALGVQVYGISRDSLRKHANFRAKHALTEPLLSDPDGAVCEAFGVWGEKTTFGRSYMGLIRSTFLIDGAGRIARTWRGVTVKGHVAEVLDAATEITR